MPIFAWILGNSNYAASFLAPRRMRLCANFSNCSAVAAFAFVSLPAALRQAEGEGIRRKWCLPAGCSILLSMIR